MRFRSVDCSSGLRSRGLLPIRLLGLGTLFRSFGPSAIPPVLGISVLLSVRLFSFGKSYAGRPFFGEREGGGLLGETPSTDRETRSHRQLVSMNRGSFPLGDPHPNTLPCSKKPPTVIPTFGGLPSEALTGSLQTRLPSGD